MGNIKRSFRRSRNKHNCYPTTNDVTEESLQVWLALPTKIRQDPSLASFQLQHQRLYGSSTDVDHSNTEAETESVADNDENNESEFITINVTNDNGITEEHEHIRTTSIPPSTDPEPTVFHTKSNIFKKHTKIICLLFIWFVSAFLLTTSKEKILIAKQVAVPDNGFKSYILPENPSSDQFSLILEGPFLPDDSNQMEVQNILSIQVQIMPPSWMGNVSANNYEIHNIVEIWNLSIPEPDQMYSTGTIRKRRTFKLDLNEVILLKESENYLCLVMETQSSEPFSFKIIYDSIPVDMHIGTIYAAFVLIFLYVLIIWEIVHRTFAAIISSILSIAILSALGDRPTMEEIIDWMDIQTLLLLFSMMILVAVLTETGIFDYIAVLTYQVTNGKIWPLIHCLCIVTCLVSSFLDNVTTILLMTPITIRLCEVMGLNPIPVLMAIVVHANIGGTLTPIGDPPNIIITLNPYIARNGVTFLTFIAHMGVGVVFVMLQTSVHLRFVFRDIRKLRLTEPTELKDLRREISVWQRAAESLSSYSKDADLVKDTLRKKVKILKHKYKKMELDRAVSMEAYQHTLEDLKATYPIKNRGLLIKSGCVLLFVLILFFIQSVPELQRLSLGWAALLGVCLLLIIADRSDMDALMSRVEWTTLLFFAAMFVTMESLARMGLINWIGKQTETIISYVSEDSRLAMAILIILWVSAITSAFVDSIPVTAMMVKVVVSLAENTNLRLPLQPMVWALAFGPCLGGNGTLYGASANVVCAGIAEQHGYRLSFVNFFKVCFPMMLGSVIVTTGYLMMAHVLCHWH